MRLLKSLLLGALCTLSTISSATLIQETTDAGNNMASAMILASNVTSVEGEIEHGRDTDLFRFTLDFDSIITIEVLEISDPLDMNLLVFNALGQGLAGDDDDGDDCNAVSVLGNLDSCLTLSLAAGDYFFGVGDNNIAGYVSVSEQLNGNDMIDNDWGILNAPTAEFMSYIDVESSNLNYTNDVGFYRMNLHVSKVPEPSSIALLAISLLLIRFKLK